VKAISSAKKDLPVGHPILPDQEAMTEEQKEERKAVVERLGDLTKKAEKGEKGAMPALRALLDEHPDLAWQLGDFARMAEKVLLRELCKDQEDSGTEEGMRRQFAAMREEIAGEDPSPLERLLAERVVATWIQVQILEGMWARRLRKSAPKQGEHYQRQLDRAHRRYLSSIKTLAQIRKLGPAVQINIAEQQINTAS
jgi:hypothetical protein